MKLSCRGLKKSFGGVHALDDVSLDFPASGIVAIVGPNGAGKTTLVDSLTGLIDLDEGSWTLDGNNITGLSTPRVARLGIVRSFQGVRLLPEETVLDNLLLARQEPAAESLGAALFSGKRPHGTSVIPEFVKGILNSTGLVNRLNDRLCSLAYGEQKLISVLVAASTGAQILLLDEPTAGVHGVAVERISNLIRTVANEGRTVVFVEHDMAVVRSLADTVVVLDRGRVLASGPPETILNRKDLLEAYFV